MNNQNTINQNIINQLLGQVKTISNAYEIVSRNTGENFNIFSLLGLETPELKTHSRIVGELLNPKGSNQQGDVFLKIFIQKLEQKFGIFCPNFKSANATTVLEKYIGKLKDRRGGIIDIQISDGKNCILIENKILAGEQIQQLQRYSTYCKETFSEYGIFYLTLDGRDSTTTEDLYFAISYSEDIIDWLEQCKKEAVNLPILREGIGQYTNLIKKLTNQTENKKMENAIIDILTHNDDAIRYSKLIRDNYDKAELQLKKKQLELLQEKINVVFKSDQMLPPDMSTVRALRNQGDGLFIVLKDFALSNAGLYQLAINVELNNNYYFFVISKKDAPRELKNNNSKMFNDIREILNNSIPESKEIYNSWTIGKSNSFGMGIIPENYFFPSVNNEGAFNDFATKVLEYYKIFNETSLDKS